MRSRTRQWLLIFAAWTALALLSAASGVAYRQALGMQVDAASFYLHSLVDWYSCAIFTPAIFAAVRRTAGLRASPAIALHAAAAALFIVARLCVFILASEALNLRPAGATFALGLQAQSFPALLTYAAVAGVGYALEFSRRARDRELHAQQLEASLATAQLDALRMQLQPHFLFNALNALSVLIHDDPDAADRMVLRLGSLLRRLIQENDRQLVALGDEIDITRQYIEIMRIRIGDRLSVQIDVDDELLDIPVPPLILQPLVENAFRHGIGAITGAAAIRVHFARANGAMTITVADNGPGIAGVTTGTGLRNVRLRLDRLYGGRASLDVKRARDGGTEARITLPAAAP